MVNVKTWFFTENERWGLEEFRRIINVLIASVWNEKGIYERSILRSMKGPAEVGDHKFIM